MDASNSSSLYKSDVRTSQFPVPSVLIGEERDRLVLISRANSRRHCGAR